jgi:hypothetical protein
VIFRSPYKELKVNKRQQGIGKVQVRIGRVFTHVRDLANLYIAGGTPHPLDP